MTERKAWIGTVALAAAAGALLSPAASRAADLACELHVTAAGYPNRTIKSNAFVKVQAPPPSGAVFTTGNVAAALDEAALRNLIPGAGTVTVIRHAEMIDLDKRKLDGRAPLYASDALCYADLVVDNVYAIFTENVSQERAGLVGAMIAGGSRMITSFWMQAYPDRTRKPAIYKKKFDSPIRTTAADMSAQPDLVRADMAQASANNLGQFTVFIAAKARK